MTQNESIYPALKPGLLLIPLNSTEFYLGEAGDGLFIPSNPYLTIARGCDGKESTNSLALQCGIPHELVIDFIEELKSRNYIECRSFPTRDPGLDELARHRRERQSPELELYTWRSATSDGGETEVSDRKLFPIVIFGQNRLARTLLANLQASGFSQTRIISPISDAGARITARDICGITTRPVDIGRKVSEFHKEISMNAQLTQYSTGPSVSAGQQWGDTHHSSGAQLLISTAPLPSDLVQQWMSEGIPHLQLSQCDAHSIDIGPLVIPGESACLNCVQLHGRDFLPPFISLATLGSLVNQRRRELTAASTSFVAGVLTPYICEFAARGESALIGRSITINLLEPLHNIGHHHWNFHPECGCGLSNALV